MGLYLSMQYLRSFVKVRLNRQDAEEHIHLVRKGLWIPANSADQVLVNHFNSFREAGNAGPSMKTEIRVQQLFSRYYDDQPKMMLSLPSLIAKKWRARSQRQEDPVDMFISRKT